MRAHRAILLGRPMLRQLRNRLKHPSFRDLLCVLAVVGILGVFFWFAELSPVSNPAGPGMNFGFGPDWDCKSVGDGDPVCIKRVK